MDVRVALLQNVADDVDFYIARNTICLEQRSTSFETWVKKWEMKEYSVMSLVSWDYVLYIINIVLF